jgi:hypothetical protein
MVWTGSCDVNLSICRIRVCKTFLKNNHLEYRTGTSGIYTVLEFIEEFGNNLKKHCGPSVSKFWVSLKNPLNTEVLMASKEVGLEVKA